MTSSPSRGQRGLQLNRGLSSPGKAESLNKPLELPRTPGSNKEPWQSPMMGRTRGSLGGSRPMTGNTEEIDTLLRQEERVKNMIKKVDSQLKSGRSLNSQERGVDWSAPANQKRGSPLKQWAQTQELPDQYTTAASLRPAVSTHSDVRIVNSKLSKSPKTPGDMWGGGGGSTGRSDSMPHGREINQLTQRLNGLAENLNELTLTRRSSRGAGGGVSGRSSQRNSAMGEPRDPAGHTMVPQGETLYGVNANRETGHSGSYGLTGSERPAVAPHYERLAV